MNWKQQTYDCVKSPSHTFERWTQFPNSETTDAEVLTESKLKEEHRDTGEEQRNEVRNEKSTCQTNDSNRTHFKDAYMRRPV